MTCNVSVNFLEEGKYALENKQMEIATENFSRAIIENDFTEPEYWYLLAESLFYQAKFNDSLACWKEAAKLDPTNKDTWIKISALYALMEQDDLAVQYYEIAEKLPINEK